MERFQRYSRAFGLPCLLVLMSLFLVPSAAAQADGDRQERGGGEESTEVTGVWDLPWSDRWKMRLNPTGNLYPRYTADPRRPRHILAVLHVVDSEIPSTGSPRFNLSVGGQYGLARFFTEREERGWQLDVAARFYAQFDIEFGLDEIGHDGRFGLIMSRKLSNDVAVRFFVDHTSNHIGDEYLLRNEITERESVRREELASGLSWQVHPRWRTYVEAGYGVNLGKVNEPGRIQWGLEYEGARIYEEIGWYGGIDVTSWQENDWEPSIAFQAGLAFESPFRGRSYRLGLEFYDGRSQLDSFFRFDERTLTWGLWLDL